MTLFYKPTYLGDMEMFEPRHGCQDDYDGLWVKFDDFHRLENAAMMVCIALAKYGGADPKTKLRNDIIEASDKILDALGVDQVHWRAHYETLIEGDRVKENVDKL